MMKKIWTNIFGSKKRNTYQKDIYFSVIMPTHNRKTLITKAIDSLLVQTYQNFELIIIDDGSSDGTEDFLKQHYTKEIECKKIKYFHIKKQGVCKARNFGLRQASYDWIAYLDSDNQMYPHFLQTFVEAICRYKKQTYYAQWDMLSGVASVWKEYNYDNLLKRNFIDLGVFVHSKYLYDKLGGFDENLTRLVDWELVLRYTKKHPPVSILNSVLLYNDNNHVRITNSFSWGKNITYILKKHHKPFCKIKFPNGRRRVYLFGFKVFSYMGKSKLKE